MNQTGHRSLQTVLRYTRDSSFSGKMRSFQLDYSRKPSTGLRPLGARDMLVIAMRKTLVIATLFLTVLVCPSRGQSKPTVTYGWIEPTCVGTNNASDPAFYKSINSDCLARTFKVNALSDNHVSGFYVHVTFWYPDATDHEIYHWTAMTLTADPDGSFTLLFPGGPSITVLSVTATELVAGESSTIIAPTVADPASTDHP